MSAPLVCMRGISKVLARGPHLLPVLHHIDLDIQAGEFLVITGPSGSGKTTLLQILGTLDQPSQGDYRFAGHDVAALPDDSRARIRAMRIGFVFQSFHLVPQLSVIDNVAMPFLYFSEAPSQPRERAKRALASVGLSHRLEHRPAQLSGGEMQRAAIARALVTEPDIVLADEPTGNLDSSTAGQILSLLEESHSRGVALVMVTHDEAIANRAPRRVRMRDGYLEQ